MVERKKASAGPGTEEFIQQSEVIHTLEARTHARTRQNTMTKDGRVHVHIGGKISAADASTMFGLNSTKLPVVVYVCTVHYLYYSILFR